MFTVSSGYPAIRRFLDRLRDEVVAMSIDAISCSRADIGTTGVPASDNVVAKQ